MELVSFNGWNHCVRLANREIELIVTTAVGPRIMRFGFLGGQNLFVEYPGQQGGTGEAEWMIRGGHRFWIAPEAKPETYELDNTPVAYEEIPGGVRTRQPAGELSGCERTMEIRLVPGANAVTVLHTLRNAGAKPKRCAPWALSALAAGGVAIVPLPEKIPHTERLTHNQEWSLWSYTDLSDPRWTIGGRSVLLRQDPARGPTKLGVAHREVWAGFLKEGDLFVKRFAWQEGAAYPDGGVNLEIFTNELFLELESIGPLVTLQPGEAASHREVWELYREVPDCRNDADVRQHILPLVSA